MTSSTSTREAEPEITSRKLADAERLGALPKHFGKLAMAFESAVFDTARWLCKAYQGDYWEFYELSNGGFYMAPSHTTDKRMQVRVPTNGYEGEFSADAFGIMVCRFAYSHLSFQRVERNDEAGAEVLSEHYYKLLEYSYKHAEAGEIAGACD